MRVNNEQANGTVNSNGGDANVIVDFILSTNRNGYHVQNSIIMFARVISVWCCTSIHDD